MPRDVEADARLRRTGADDGPISRLDTALSWLGVAVLAASIAFILGATLLT